MSNDIKAISVQRYKTDDYDQSEKLRLQNDSKIAELQRLKEEKLKALNVKTEELKQNKVAQDSVNISSGRKPASLSEPNETVDTSKQLYDRKGALNMKAYQQPPIQSNYTSLEEDLFYKVIDRGNQIKEEDNGYFIEAFAPQHEKDNIRISISHNKAVISGSRKFEDTVKINDKSITNNNYQTFREEFALSKPIDSSGITRERKGDYIRFFIPKLTAQG